MPACGVQKRDVREPDCLPYPAVVERDISVPVGKAVPFEDIREVRDEREEKHAERVFVDVPRVEESLRDEEAHGWHGDAPDDVHQLRLPVQRTSWIDRPRDVVDRHGDDRDQLDRVRIQYLVVLHPVLHRQLLRQLHRHYPAIGYGSPQIVSPCFIRALKYNYPF